MSTHTHVDSDGYDKDGAIPRTVSTQGKHTPGPWKPDSQFTLYPKIHGANFEHICDVEGKNTTANARLIAAAPELLEACKVAKRELGNYTHTNQTLAMLMLSDVISKAEGKQ